ncbi:MAG: (2Fe-2S) ferredoxin domain-containing protein [Clostridia bacterium]|nr:(2Fe-2S) ferredoxin domain-containing protein [Clostridia bacterium]
MKITVCIGSSCHIKGSRQVVEQLQYLVRENDLGSRIELGGTFCMGKCQQGVCVTVDGEFFSVSPETVNDFFETNVKAKLLG